MFLFLSKLLPLFVYPLGFACLCLLVALITVWKRPRIAAVSITLALLVLGLAGNAWVSASLVRSLEVQHVPTAELPNADAIVVLGGSVRPQVPPRPWVEVSEEGDRPLYGALLYREGKAPRVILSGGRISWMSDGSPESEDMATILKAMGVPAEAILQDPDSLNTYENAVNVKQILEENGMNRILLVTSALHMPRSLMIFRKLGIEAIAAPTDFWELRQVEEESLPTIRALLIKAIPDASNLESFTRALKEYIGIVVYRLRGWL
ncbi:MAG: YdcF family protein [Synechococcales bacterium]|nr:YdcF family protein [Synechococcales bacterium]